ncbi:hypothetical protein [Mucilaginibacter lappiensis]
MNKLKDRFPVNAGIFFLPLDLFCTQVVGLQVELVFRPFAMKNLPAPE